jgi:succinate-acetate transporter protein
LTRLSLIPLAAAFVLGAAIVYAGLSANIVDSFAAVAGDPWGLVALIDLYAGFVVILVVIALVEPRRPVTVACVLLTPFLGSLVPAVWLAARIALLRNR